MYCFWGASLLVVAEDAYKASTTAPTAVGSSAEHVPRSALSYDVHVQAETYRACGGSNLLIPLQLHILVV